MTILQRVVYVRFGSLAAPFRYFSLMSALERKADAFLA